MAVSAWTVLQIGAGLVLLWVVKLAVTPREKPKAPLPPGPKPKPIVGNLADLPSPGAKEWEHWGKHKDLYGPISSVSAFGMTIIVLNDAELALKLLDKRSNIHSGRPRMVFGMEMCGWEHLLAGKQPSNEFRAYRQKIHKFIGTTAALSRFYPLQDVEARRFLLRVLEKPDELLKHLRTEAGAIILKMGYGYTVESHGHDPLVHIADEALRQFSLAAVPGVWLVDTFPILRYLPSWVPGAGFKRTARQWYATLMELAERPMHFVEKQMRTGEHEHSFASDLYEKADGKMSAEDEYVAKYSAASLYTGGADTSVSGMYTFFLTMTLYPEIQIKAREEIDRVVGTHRLPTFEDRAKLPYVEAVVKEVFRWHPIAPMCIPHVASTDDIFEGYLIPKGAAIIPNIWLYTHDPSVFTDPMAFNPERYLGEDPPPDSRDHIFGYGRRICPGKLLADSSVWLTIAKSLAALDIQKPVDSDGKVIEPKIDFSTGIISHPFPFKADIKPRSPRHEQLIRAVEEEHPWTKSNAEDI